VVSFCASTQKVRWEGEFDGNKENGRCRKRGDLHKEINNSISHKLLHVLVRLPLLGCFVHLNQWLQGWDESKNQECNTKRQS